jgi:hypothetical protein
MILNKGKSKTLSVDMEEKLDLAQGENAKSRKKKTQINSFRERQIAEMSVFFSKTN